MKRIIIKGLCIVAMVSLFAPCAFAIDIDIESWQDIEDMPSNDINATFINDITITSAQTTKTIDDTQTYNIDLNGKTVNGSAANQKLFAIEGSTDFSY